jgi:hypothetical protein
MSHKAVIFILVAVKTEISTYYPVIPTVFTHIKSKSKIYLIIAEHVKIMEMYLLSLVQDIEDCSVRLTPTFANHNEYSYHKCHYTLHKYYAYRYKPTHTFVILICILLILFFRF